LLSGSNPGIITGNFIGDSVHGSSWANYEPDIQRGILFHREIDSFSDAHPVMAQSTARIRNNHGKYAPVITDIFYDHFLAIDWDRYSRESLEDFSARVKTILKSYATKMPAKSRIFLNYMDMADIPASYAKPEGIKSVLRGMGRRAKFKNSIPSSIETLENHYETFRSEFHLFFPDLIRHAEKWLGGLEKLSG
jgi:acyl carrier protein phosphodiesterase